MVKIKNWIEKYGWDSFKGSGFCVMLYLIIFVTLSLSGLGFNKDNQYISLGVLFSYISSMISSSVKLGRSLKENDDFEKAFSIGFFFTKFQ
ncbi:MAG: hypothetical protein ACTSRI_21160 [Promethearchaeota archaeon]